jgi:alanyl-tRNA synthetase
VIADHIRACSFLIVDGVLPSNEGRGYVLRRIIRRASATAGCWACAAASSTHGRPLVEQMGEAYPELREKQATGRAALRPRKSASPRRSTGMRIFDDVAARSSGHIPGADAFRLYDTYGFPVDLTADIARERGMGVDMAGFDAAMEKQRERARAASKFGRRHAPAAGRQPVADRVPRLRAIWRARAPDRRPAPRGRVRRGLIEASDGMVILDRTPFYAESGGQVGDTASSAPAAPASRCATPRSWPASSTATSATSSSGSLKVGDVLAARVDSARPGHRAQPQRHPPAARRAARSARHPRAAEGLAGRARPPALRLQPLPGDQRRAS